MMEASSHHRLIELQSPADLQYLQDNVKRAARQKIDLHLPPSAAPEGEDALRRRVEELVDQYIRDTFMGVRSNVSVNGMPLVGEDRGADVEEFEPIDERLKSRIESGQMERDALIEKVAKLRQKVPREAAKNWQNNFNTRQEEVERRTKEERESMVNDVPERPLHLNELKRLKEMQDTWKGMSEQLRELNEGIAGTAGRLERAGEAVSYMEGKK